MAVGGSVWATSIGTDLTVSGTATVDGASTLTGAVTASAAVTVGTDLTVTSGARVGTGSTADHLTALADDSLFVEGQAEYDGIAWFDESLRASSTVMTTGAVTIGAGGTSFTNILYGFCDFGPIVASQSIVASTTGTVACTGQVPSGLAAGDKVWLTASTTASGVVGGSVIYTGIASSTATTRIQAMVFNGTGAAWTVTTSTWQYFIIK